MAYYTTQERIELILIYGEAKRCVREAIRLYTERFPGRNSPSRSSYAKLVKKFEQTGSVINKNRPRCKTVTHETNVRSVIAAIDHNPHISLRQISRELDISKSSISRILKVQKFHPFHLSLHQDLHGNDFENRISFCQWALQQYQIDVAFFKKFYLRTKHFSPTMAT
ncbi:hypothetical protein KPH14_012171 [Odynerus spinipes]|uniref:DUF4817 domain-containing protein n=1 Tax=Odynerus spinipes TaxID=1348599 RepID=A0AAD9RDV6_9HYME|nr:hypothetical protein KPH14_012171 [Odynerus spinipes]